MSSSSPLPRFPTSYRGKYCGQQFPGRNIHNAFGAIELQVICFRCKLVFDLKIPFRLGSAIPSDHIVPYDLEFWTVRTNYGRALPWLNQSTAFSRHGPSTLEWVERHRLLQLAVTTRVVLNHVISWVQVKPFREQVSYHAQYDDKGTQKRAITSARP